MNILLKIITKYLYKVQLTKDDKTAVETAVLRIYFIKSFVKSTIGISQKIW